LPASRKCISMKSSSRLFCSKKTSESIRKSVTKSFIISELFPDKLREKKAKGANIPVKVFL
jgi:ribosomal protein L30E